MWDLTVPGNNDHDFYIELLKGPFLSTMHRVRILLHRLEKSSQVFRMQYSRVKGRARHWKDGKLTFQWDYQHGAVEVYRKKTHPGEFDAYNGSQNKPGKPGRKPSGC